MTTSHHWRTVGQLLAVSLPAVGHFLFTAAKTETHGEMMTSGKATRYVIIFMAMDFLNIS